MLVTAKEMIRDKLRDRSIDVNPIFWGAFDAAKFIRLIESLAKTTEIGERHLATGSSNLEIEAIYEFGVCPP